MAANQGAIIAAVFHGTDPILRLDFQQIAWQQMTQPDTALNLGFNDVEIHGVAEIRVRRKRIDRWDGICWNHAGQAAIAPPPFSGGRSRRNYPSGPMVLSVLTKASIANVANSTSLPEAGRSECGLRKG
jgi:hypothetical protein